MSRLQPEAALPLVSIIIPAYNCAATIGATMESATGQTYPNLEIVVVDDGSTDSTPTVLESLAASDPRIRTIRTPNGGVAAARNTGLHASRGTFVAPLDADDLWHPERVAKHVDALLRAGAEYAVAYSPYLLIDAHDRVIGYAPWPPVTGDAMAALLRSNVIGNGSGMMVRREAMLEVGGYASWLRERNAQGCEDMLIQLQLAHRYKFVCVPEFLIGYRKAPGQMSNATIAMRRSHVLAMEAVGKLDGIGSRPDYRAALVKQLSKLYFRVLLLGGVMPLVEELRLHRHLGRNTEALTVEMVRELVRKTLKAARIAKRRLLRGTDTRFRGTLKFQDQSWSVLAVHELQ